ncbi:MAG: nitrous oxide reductase accessory protein NosL [Saprospiraceae bacterium]
MNTYSKLSKSLLILAGLCIFSAVFLPIWRIELDAPQYPEGLGLLIYASRLAGDVEIINGLNHYIGMKTLHAEEFIEFTVLPYIIGFFGLWTILTAFLQSKRAVIILLICFALFGALAMYDFWRWEYEYGHNLDPTAAIIVPGMAYQPPLIGFKQLLNFGAYSIPDIGGWLMLTGGVLIGFVYVLQAGFLDKIINRSNKLSLFLGLPLALMLNSCVTDGPQTININKDNCAHCKMTIAEEHFAAEMITEKGRVYKFDDISCLIAFRKDNEDKKMKNAYVHYYPGNNELIPAETAFYIKSSELRSPMAGNIAAFKTKAEANEYKIKLKGEFFDWNSVQQNNR